MQRILFLLLFSTSISLLAAQPSRLSNGKIFKIGIKENGLYQLNYTDLEDLGINPNSVDPKNIHMLTGEHGMLPGPISLARIDDLVEVPILVNGENDSRLNDGDQIIFYGLGPDKWVFNEEESIFTYEKNVYSDINYYFIKIDDQPGKRIENFESISSSSTQDYYLDRQHYEKEQNNLLHAANDNNLQGSGKRWFGESFNTERSRDFSRNFDFTNRITSTPISIHIEFAGRHSASHSFNCILGSETLNGTIRRTNIGSIEDYYAQIGSIVAEITLNDPDPDVVIEYPLVGSPNNVGWLDYITLNFERRLIYNGESQMTFSHPNSISLFNIGYEIISQESSEILWDITDAYHPVQQSFDKNGEKINFGTNGMALKTFLLSASDRLKSPELIGEQENQNLHEINNLEYLVIYHKKFEEAAKRLLDFRISHNGFRAAAVDIEQVYNEYSSGKVDPTAIRDFVRQLYNHSDNFEYLLLFGDGSFDYKHIYENLNDESFIPVYETDQSLHSIISFPSDDYYALLDPQEGTDNLRGALDISVGRLPVRTSTEANLMFEKIQQYETSEKTLGDWRLNLLFVADDEDGNTHIDASDSFSRKIESNFPIFNHNKVYLDAYEQEITPGGVFNPKAKQQINQNIFQGQLAVNYIGHGGSNGWAQERVLLHEDIDSWNNYDKLPLLITATCSFAGYDNPAKTTAGEYTLIHPEGGAIALFTTVRAVYSSANERLTEAVLDRLFKKENGDYPLIGEILKNAKNSNRLDTSGTNARKFSLLGDPAIRLAIPRYIIQTTKINNQPIQEFNDTLHALTKYTIEGEVIDISGNLASSFNGNLYPVIYDKKVDLKTLGQDDEKPFDFMVQKNIIFKGLATVANGRFKFSFVVPTDINYVIGPGKISYYAENNTQLDAGGSINNILIGGSNPNGIKDEKGPDIELFMDDESFVSGGVTSENPELLILLEDDNGISITGNSIGHDLTAILDNNQNDKIVLNEFYNAIQDDYSKGKVMYPLTDLTPGPHTLRVKAWDIANNSNEALIDFVVAEKDEAGLRNVYNYPNPFSDRTTFTFEHNFVNQDIEIRADIYTVSGKLINTLIENIKSSSRLSQDLTWDGRDEFGDRIGTGVYLYKLTISTLDGLGKQVLAESNFKKLLKL